MNDNRDLIVDFFLLSCAAAVCLAICVAKLQREVTHEGFIRAKSINTGENAFGGHTDTSFSFDLWTVGGMVEVFVTEDAWHDSEVGDYIEWTGKHWRTCE